MKTTKKLRANLREMQSVCGGAKHYETEKRLKLNQGKDYLGMALDDVDELEAKLKERAALLKVYAIREGEHFEKFAILVGALSFIAGLDYEVLGCLDMDYRHQEVAKEALKGIE